MLKCCKLPSPITGREGDSEAQDQVAERQLHDGVVAARASEAAARASEAAANGSGEMYKVGGRESNERGTADGEPVLTIAQKDPGRLIYPCMSIWCEYSNLGVLRNTVFRISTRCYPSESRV